MIPEQSALEAQKKCCSPFCVLRVILVSLCSIFFFLLGMIINCCVIPLVLITLILCGPVYCIKGCCGKAMEEASKTKVDRGRYNMELDDP